MDDSPHHHQTPDPRPETPTPQPGATKRARAASQCSQCETQDLEGIELAVHMTKTMEWAHLEAQSLQRGLLMQIGYAAVSYFMPDLA